nr:hypothetical protein [Tanacetum cinerariifolium]
MSWYSRCLWCGGPFNGGNCRRCTNVSFRDELVRNPDPISNDETPDFSYPPSQPQTPSLEQLHCFECKDPLEEGERCQRYTCKWCGNGLSKGFCFFCASIDEKSSINVPNPNSFNDTPNIFTHPPQPQNRATIKTLCQPMNQNYFEPNPNYNSNYSGFDQPPQYSINHQPQIIHEDQEWINDDDYKESTIPLNEIVSQIPSSIVINTSPPVLPIEDPKDSLIMGDEDLSTIPMEIE